MRKVFVGIAVSVVVLAGMAAAWHHVLAQQDVPPSQVAIGGKVANVELATLSAETVRLYDYAGQNGTLVLFVSTRCPVSNDYNQRMAEVARDYMARGFAVIGINPNRNEPADEVARHTTEKALGFTVLKDPNNKVADYLGASVTPEAYLFGKDWTLRYHGRIDDSRNPANITARDLRAALDAVQEGKAVPVAETKAFGCTIKRVAKGA
jgi:peroxiredoxin